MPIKFISLNNDFINKIKAHGFDAQVGKIEDYQPNQNRRTYYISPANSLCFMDGGIDLSLSRTVFPYIETRIKTILHTLNITTKLGRPYLPIGSSVIIDYDKIRSLVVAPTMLLPQDVSKTDNAYYSTLAILYNILINKNENINDVDIIFTSLCCGFGKMDVDESINQILEGIKDYPRYKPNKIHHNIILCEPNLLKQPKYYQNTEWFDVNIQDIQKV